MLVDTGPDDTSLTGPKVCYGEGQVLRAVANVDVATEPLDVIEDCPDCVRRDVRRVLHARTTALARRLDRPCPRGSWSE